MTQRLIIREEAPGDAGAIAKLIDQAFAGKVYADGTEAQILPKLHEAGAVVLSLVGVVDGEIIAQAAFSPASIGENSERIYALGPVAVEPFVQRQGIGTALIREGLARMRAIKACAVVLTGDPNYYSRFGFEVSPKLTYKGEPYPYLQILVLGGEQFNGDVRFHPAFGD